MKVHQIRTCVEEKTMKKRVTGTLLIQDYVCVGLAPKAPAKTLKYFVTE